MPFTPFEAISLRPLLRQSLEPLLASRNLGQAPVLEFAAEVMGSVSRYREEGKRLFPVVFLCRDLERLLRECGGEDPIEIGQGRADIETARRMLKLCSPLGEGRSWVIYAVAGGGDNLRFGVFRAPRSAVLPTALERLRASVDPGLEACGFVQIAEGVVEARVSCDRRLYASVDGSSDRLEPPTQVIKDFIASVRRDAPEAAREAIGRFYYRVLIDVMQVWHGTLAAVIPFQGPFQGPLQASARPAGLLEDAVTLAAPIDVAQHVLDYLRDGTEATSSRLNADANLIRGMLAADGITVFRSDGAVVGYNAFLHRLPDGAPAQASTTLGGARQRAFEQLSALVGHELVAAFCRSQDGTAFCRASWSALPRGN